MASVTNRIRSIKQPRGGYLPIKQFETIDLSDDEILSENENISAALVGMSVDYLTRFLTNNSVTDAFKISLMGAKRIGKIDLAENLLSNIKDLSNKSIESACKLVGFDVCFRLSPSYYKPVEEINPDKHTINNIRIMVKRSLTFFEKYGPVTHSHITFEGAYTKVVDSGDADFVTEDTLWDIKVSKNKPLPKDTLQILMYYIMGKHSKNVYFNKIKKLGLFNPRLNKVFLCDVSSIEDSVYKEVENEIVGYKYGLDDTREKMRELLHEIRKNAEQRDNQRKINHSQENRGSYNSIIDGNKERYTVTELIPIMGISRSQIYKLINSGRLSAYKEGKYYYIDHEDLMIYFERLQKRKRMMTYIWIGYAVSIVLFLFIYSFIYNSAIS